MNISVSMINPGGNITLIVKGLPSKQSKNIINNRLLQQFPEAEQVGFYESNNLEMAGGEFCGNAVRCLAYLLRENNQEERIINIVGKQITTRVYDNYSITEIPIYNSFSSISRPSQDIFQVAIEGITHLIKKNSSFPDKESYKAEARILLEQYNLLTTQPAAGVMFINSLENDPVINVHPVVWVRDIQTLFYETACGSGTTAIGLWKSLEDKKNVTEYLIRQPSGSLFTTTITKDMNQFISAQIGGPIETIFTQKQIRI